VEDVVALNIKAAEAPSGVCGRMYNGGNGDRITLNEAWNLLQRIEGVTIPPSTVRHAPATSRIRRPTRRMHGKFSGTIRSSPSNRVCV